jgi:hydrogenase nickel incorporation protein HypB
MRDISVQEAILSENDRLAARNRELLVQKGIFTVNLMASPGAGKTSLIAGSIKYLCGGHRLAVIEGDIASSIDTDRLASMGVPAVQINTGGDCHLEALAVAQALSRLALDEIDILIIENVGNLICPTAFDLGESSKVMVSSISEGDDKPQKYPAMFQAVDVVVLNKTDLIGICPFDRGPFLRAIRQLNPDVQIFELSCLTGAGMDAWGTWLNRRVEEIREIHRTPLQGGQE